MSPWPIPAGQGLSHGVHEKERREKSSWLVLRITPFACMVGRGALQGGEEVLQLFELLEFDYLSDFFGLPTKWYAKSHRSVFDAYQ